MKPVENIEKSTEYSRITLGILSLFKIFDCDMDEDKRNLFEMLVKVKKEVVFRGNFKLY